MSDQMRSRLPCGRPFVSSSREAHCTSLISMKGNVPPAVSMDSSRASSLRAMARAPTTPSSLSFGMPDLWTLRRSLTRLLSWDESCTTKAFGLRLFLQRHNLIERPLRRLLLALWREQRLRVFDLTVSNEALEFLVRHGIQKTLGARPMRRTVRKFIGDAARDAPKSGVPSSGVLTVSHFNDRLIIQ
jgi:hypothetical protein